MQNNLIENYSISPDVKWSVETCHILMWDPSGKEHIVEYPQAAIWDLMARQYKAHNIIKRLVFIIERSEQDIESLYVETTRQWFNNGIIIQSGETN